MTIDQWRIIDLGESTSGPNMWAVTRDGQFAATISSRPEYGLDFAPDGEPAIVGFTFYLLSCTTAVGDMEAFQSYSLTRLLHTVIGWIKLSEDPERPELAELIDEYSRARARYRAGDRDSGLLLLELEQQLIDRAYEHIEANELQTQKLTTS